MENGEGQGEDFSITKRKCMIDSIGINFTSIFCSYYECFLIETLADFYVGIVLFQTVR